MKQFCIVVILLSIPVAGAAQLFVTDQGILSGSGLTVLPTAGTIPRGHWRGYVSRMDFLKSGLKGLNVLGLNYGLSGYVEGYVRLTAEQTGMMTSLTTYGFGGKVMLPVRIPHVLRTGAWFESTGTDELHQSRLFPSKAIRGGISTAFGSRTLSPLLLLGLTKLDGGSHPLIGGGVAAAVSNSVQVGVEVVRGYAQESAMHYMADAAVRVLPFASIFLSTGYVVVPGISSWTLSLGFALTTVDIDFNPVMDLGEKDEYRLPSIEEIMNPPTGDEPGGESPGVDGEETFGDNQETSSEEGSNE